MTSLNDDEIEEIVQKAAEQASDLAVKKLTDRFYREVGKSVLSKFFTVVGILVVAALSWAYGTGFFK